VPRVATELTLRDKFGTIGARTGFSRNNYKITPGLYCIGEPNITSPVLVTANYKLSFDALRQELVGINAWLLVIDTRGINVWCAAGKGTFSAEEIAYQVHKANLNQIVTHRELLLPQLCANGVTAHELKKLCGFRGRFGPILASDLPKFLQIGEADEDMRTVTFTLRERAVLIPLEICMLWKHLIVVAMIIFILSGISPDFFSPTLAINRGILLVYATLTAMLAGAIATPLLLPWLPFRQFWLKGAIMGSLASLLLLFVGWQSVGSIEKIAIFLWTIGCSAYLAMNFTGSTPFTSLSGVTKEMRRGLVFQISSAVLAIIFWMAGPFV
jgi:hypothetical protein